jgi:hypothetical protein
VQHRDVGPAVNEEREVLPVSVQRDVFESNLAARRHDNICGLRQVAGHLLICQGCLVEADVVDAADEADTGNQGVPASCEVEMNKWKTVKL